MRSGFEALGRLRLQAVFLLAGVFVVGVLGGVAIERARGGGQPPRRPMGPPPEGLPPELVRSLDLSAEQAERIRAIFERHRPRTEELLDEFLPRLRAVTDSARAEIRATLTPAQQEVFDREQPPGFGPRGPRRFEGGPPTGHRGFGDHPPDRGGSPGRCPEGFGAPPPEGRPESRPDTTQGDASHAQPPR